MIYFQKKYTPVGSKESQWSGLEPGSANKIPLRPEEGIEMQLSPSDFIISSKEVGPSDNLDGGKQRQL